MEAAVETIETPHEIEPGIVIGNNDLPTLQLMDLDAAGEVAAEAYRRHEAAIIAVSEAEQLKTNLSARIAEINRSIAEISKESLVVRTAIYREVISTPEGNISKKAQRIEALRMQSRFLIEALEIATGIELKLESFRLMEAQIWEIHSDSMLWQAAAKVEAIKRGRILMELAQQEGVVSSQNLENGKTKSMEMRARELWLKAYAMQERLQLWRKASLADMGIISVRFGYTFADEPATRIDWSE